MINSWCYHPLQLRLSTTNHEGISIDLLCLGINKDGLDVSYLHSVGLLHVRPPCRPQTKKKRHSLSMANGHILTLKRESFVN